MHQYTQSSHSVCIYITIAARLCHNEHAKVTPVYKSFYEANDDGASRKLVNKYEPVQ